MVAEQSAIMDRIISHARVSLLMLFRIVRGILFRLPFRL